MKISAMEAIHLLIFSLLTLAPKSISSLSLRSIDKSPIFGANVALFGDAEIADGGSSVQLTRPISSSSGFLMHIEPFKFLESNSNKTTSFSTDFSFSISPHSGDGIALVIVPTSFPSKLSKKTMFGLSRDLKFLGIEFDTSMDENVGDENANHVGVDVGSFVSARIGNVSSLNLVLNSGVKLRSWIDYDASSKRLEVRLSEMGNKRPYNALIAFPIDLSQMWKGEDVVVGISSSTGNSAQTSRVYSWNFRTRTVPHWMHSQPLDPALYSHKGRQERAGHKKVSCHLTVLSAVILAVACGALVVLTRQFLRAIFANKGTVISGEYSLKPPGFQYEKVSVMVENGAANAKN